MNVSARHSHSLCVIKTSLLYYKYVAVLNLTVSLKMWFLHILVLFKSVFRCWNLMLRQDYRKKTSKCVKMFNNFCQTIWTVHWHNNSYKSKVVHTVGMICRTWSSIIYGKIQTFCIYYKNSACSLSCKFDRELRPL